MRASHSKRNFNLSTALGAPFFLLTPRALLVILSTSSFPKFSVATDAPVAQMDRATGFEPVGRGSIPSGRTKINTFRRGRDAQRQAS